MAQGRQNWQEVAAPSFAGVGAMMSAAGSSWDNGMNTLLSGLDRAKLAQQERLSNAALLPLANVGSDAEAAAALGNLTIDPRNISAAAMETIMGTRARGMDLDTARMGNRDTNSQIGYRDGQMQIAANRDGRDQLDWNWGDQNRRDEAAWAATVGAAQQTAYDGSYGTRQNGAYNPGGNGSGPQGAGGAMPDPTSYVRYQNQGATRSLPLDDRLVGAMSFLPEMGVTMEVHSGGQSSAEEGGPRTGSTRHDHGMAGDVDFYQGDRKLDWNNPDDLPLLSTIVQRAKGNGVTGIGAGDDYMGAGRFHIGFGDPGVWGAGGKGANAPEWLRAAYDGVPAAQGGMPTQTGGNFRGDIMAALPENSTLSMAQVTGAVDGVYGAYDRAVTDRQGYRTTDISNDTNAQSLLEAQTTWNRDQRVAADTELAAGMALDAVQTTVSDVEGRNKIIDNPDLTPAQKTLALAEIANVDREAATYAGFQPLAPAAPEGYSEIQQNVANLNNQNAAAMSGNQLATVNQLAQTTYSDPTTAPTVLMDKMAEQFGEDFTDSPAVGQRIIKEVAAELGVSASTAAALLEQTVQQGASGNPFDGQSRNTMRFDADAAIKLGRDNLDPEAIRAASELLGANETQAATLANFESGIAALTDRIQQGKGVEGYDPAPDEAQRAELMQGYKSFVDGQVAIDGTNREGDGGPVAGSGRGNNSGRGGAAGPVMGNGNPADIPAARPSNARPATQSGVDVNRVDPAAQIAQAATRVEQEAAVAKTQEYILGIGGHVEMLRAQTPEQLNAVKSQIAERIMADRSIPDAQKPIMIEALKVITPPR